MGEMGRTIYACRFELTAGDPSLTSGAYRTWIEDVYRRRRGISDFRLDDIIRGVDPGNLPQRHQISVAEYLDGDNAVERIVWKFPDDGDANLLWTNEIRICRFDGRQSVEHLISIESIEYWVSPPSINFGSPAVIRRLCTENSVYVGDMNVRATPYRLTGAGVQQFLDLLQSPLRRLPLVLITPYASDDSPEIDSEALANRLAAVAVVVEFIDTETTWKLTDEIGRKLSCFDGGVRIYWPGFRRDDNIRRHPLYISAEIEERGVAAIMRDIENTIFSVASFRFVSDVRMMAVVRASEEVERAKSVANQKASKGLDWEKYALEIDGDLSSANKKILELEAENENLRMNQQVLFEYRNVVSGEISSSEVTDNLPTNVKEAVEQAHQKFDQLDILPSAYISANGSPFARPEEIFDALDALNEVVGKWKTRRKQEGSGGDIRQYLIGMGFGRVSMHISNTTKSKYGSQYTFQYKNNKKMFEPHITLGSGNANTFASIHFILDEDREKIVVAYVGRHLDNTKT